MDASISSGQVPQAATSELEEAAKKSGVDPCDVACEAMPAHVVGDLTVRDEVWLHEHTEECNYCANELRRYDTLNELLTKCCAVDEEAVVPPPVALPRRERVWYTRIASPIGDLILAATPEGLREIEFGFNVEDAVYAMKLRQRGAEPVRLDRIEDANPEVRAILDRAAAQLREYFGGQRDRFDIPLDWGQMAPFQRAVLEATADVPFGQLDTYAGIARRIGKPRATRAVGNALGRNPIPVIVPCHRVVRSDQTLGGYTGGIGIKQRLLTHEGVRLAPR
jgi:methylated-DNA-[protein]-cysteine S-methyltransferase